MKQMNAIFVRILTVFFSALLVEASLADIHVEYYDAASSLIRSDTFSSSQPISVVIDDSAILWVKVFAGPNSENMEQITVSGTTQQQEVRLLLSAGDLDISALVPIPPSDAAALDSKGISNAWTGGVLRFKGRILGNLNGPVNVGNLESLHVDGSISGSINSAGGIFSLVAGSIAQGVAITQTVGDIFNIDVRTGDMDGDVFITDEANGNIVDFVVDNGSLGSSLDPDQFPTISLQGDIVQALVANNAIRANISANTVRWIEATTGVMDGSLSVQNILDNPPVFGPDPAEIIAGGDLDADINVANNLDAGLVIDVSGSIGGLISLGGSLDGAINTGVNGLAGQVIVNANNGAGTWDPAADVTIGTTTLAPVPDYVDLQGSIGNGAVGVVPFNVHPKDSEPDLSATVATPPAEVRIWHYGPIYGDGTGQVLLIERSGDGGRRGRT